MSVPAIAAIEVVDEVTTGRIAGPGLDVVDRAVFLAAQHAGDELEPIEQRCEATGKLTHASEAAARRFAYAFTGRGHVKKGRPYLCALCGGWHLTTGRRYRVG